MTAPRTLGHDLSPRELAILGHVADGLRNEQIAGLLGLSPLTVKSHLARLGRKLGTGDRAGMVGVAFRAGWLR